MKRHSKCYYRIVPFPNITFICTLIYLMWMVIPHGSYHWHLNRSINLCLFCCILVKKCSEQCLHVKVSSLKKCPVNSFNIGKVWLQSSHLSVFSLLWTLSICCLYSPTDSTDMLQSLQFTCSLFECFPSICDLRFWY